MDAQALKAFLVLCLLALDSTCEAGDKCSQQRDCSRNEIRRCEDLPYRQDATCWLHVHSARVTRSVLDRGRGDSPVGLRRNRNTLKDRDESGRGSKSDNSLPVETIDGVIHSNARHDSASESGNGTLGKARPE
nr:MAG TPA: hypothetical protein [Caudoviricetes sp.]